MRNDKELHKAVLAVMLGKKDEQVDEALHPNQKQLDKNNNGKLDKQDFEMLRKGKKAESEDEDESEEKMEEAAQVEEESIEEARFKKGEDVGGPGMNFAKIAKSAAAKYGSKEAGQRVAGAVLKKVLAKEEAVEEIEEEVDETIIYHKALDIEIKESYTFGEYLNAAKNLVSEEEAIQLANDAYRAQDTSIFAEEVSRMDIENRVKQHTSAGHKVSMPKYSTRDGKLHAEYIVTDKESGVRRKYIHHGNMRKVENMGTAGKKDEE